MKKQLAAILASTMLLGAAGLTAAAADPVAAAEADTWDGSATQEWYEDGSAETFTISTAEDLAGLAELVNGGTNFAGKTITLETDIDLANIEWTPIGKSGALFSGTFNGQEHTISNLKINNDQEDYCGFFYCLSGAAVTDLHISGADVTSSGWTGVLAGRAEDAEITGCTVSGEISAIASTPGSGIAAAGLVEYSYRSQITDCTSKVMVTASSMSNGFTYAGGIACEVNNSTITNCTNIGVITGTSSDDKSAYTYAGGIATYVKNGATVTGCTNYGAVTAGDSNTFYAVAGGILGQIWAEAPGTITVTGCTNIADIAAYAIDGSGWACSAGQIGETYVYDGNGKKTNTLVLDGMQKGDIGWAQQDEAVVDLVKPNGDIYGYAALEDALKDAEPGDTVEMTRDMADIGSLSIDKNIIFEGRGHIISGDSSLNFKGDVGGTVQNVNFENIHNENNNKSAIYASGLTAELVVKDCSFDNVDWDCIQVTPYADTASVVITGNAFRNSSIQGQRFIHVESRNAASSGQYANYAFSAEITGNKFYGTDGNLSQEALEVYFFTAPEKVNLEKNYFQDPGKVWLSSDYVTYKTENDKIYPYYENEEMTQLVYLPTATVLSANAVDAVKEGAEGTIRFITKVDALNGTATSFGTYILPLFVFEHVEKDWSDELTAVVTYTGEDIAADQTYAADLTGIPEKYFGEDIVAQSFMVVDGETVTSDLFNAVSVDDLAQ